MRPRPFLLLVLPSNAIVLTFPRMDFEGPTAGALPAGLCLGGTREVAEPVVCARLRDETRVGRAAMDSFCFCFASCTFCACTLEKCWYLRRSAWIIEPAVFFRVR